MSFFTKIDDGTSTMAKQKNQPNGIFVAETSTAEDALAAANNPHAHKYRNLNIQYMDDNVSEYAGSGAKASSVSSISAHVKVPVSLETGGVMDKETGQVNPYGKIVVGNMVIGPDQHEFPLDLTALDLNINKLNRGSNNKEERISVAMAHAESAEQQREIMERRNQERKMNQEQTPAPTTATASFDDMISQANNSVQEKIFQNLSQEKTAVQLPPAYPQQPQQLQPPQPSVDIATLVAREVAMVLATANKPALVSEKEPVEPTPSIRVTLKGSFGTSTQKYKGYEKQDNMIILMYNIDDNMFEPPRSDTGFTLSIDSGAGDIETHTAYFVGLAFELRSLQMGFQIYTV